MRWTWGGHREVRAQNNILNLPFEHSTTVLDSRPWHERNYFFWPVQKRTLKCSANTHVWVLAPLPLRPPCVYLRDECSKAFFVLLSSHSSVLLWTQTEGRNRRGRLGTRLIQSVQQLHNATIMCVSKQCYMHILPQAIERSGAVEQGGGWFRSVSNFLSNSFYWWQCNLPTHLFLTVLLYCIVQCCNLKCCVLMSHQSELCRFVMCFQFPSDVYITCTCMPVYTIFKKVK